jgi:hypothetical protein
MHPKEHSMPDDGRTSAWIQVFGVVTAALIAAGVAIWTQRSASPSPRPALPSDPDRSGTQGPPVMGQLEVGINRQGMDLSAEGRVTANAETCAELAGRAPTAWP